MSDFSHLNESGDVHMVDVGGKRETRRRAVAEGRIDMAADTLAKILQGGSRKGDVLGIARVAGIMAAKKTAELVPLCHPLPLSRVEIELSPAVGLPGIVCRATTETVARTGVEMEALTAVQIALLTVYDMCKSVDRAMTITEIRLIAKSGGRSGEWRRPAGDD